MVFQTFIDNFLNTSKIWRPLSFHLLLQLFCVWAINKMFSLAPEEDCSLRLGLKDPSSNSAKTS